MSTDNINHPSHYTNDRFPFECINITLGTDFCTGNMIKYVWRHLDKGKPLEDLKKARFYLNYETQHNKTPTAWPMTETTQNKLQELADPANHYDYWQFWQALYRCDTGSMLAWLDQEITRLETSGDRSNLRVDHWRSPGGNPMIVTHGDADFTVEHAKDRVRITAEQDGNETIITMPAKYAMQLSEKIGSAAAAAMTEDA